MDKTKEGEDQGWELGMSGVVVVGVKWRQLHLDSNKKKKKKELYANSCHLIAPVSFIMYS